MPPLSNARREAFARLVAKGEAASRAYASVYGVSGHTAEVSAHRLLRNDGVAARVDELKSVAAKRTTKTVASLVSDLDQIIAFSKECRNPAAMVAAVNSQARLLGLMIDRSEQVVLRKPAPLPTAVIELSEAEWVRQFGSGPAPTRTLPGAKRSKADQRKPPPAIRWDASTGEILKARMITIGDDDDSD
ncbi:terminase small subunit [Rhizobium sp. NLR17b]|uniref:terminase small subunit n=1 Tax=unclassified Rhizobium TaxID=2613769 RepID=UPI001C83E4D6|nr:terminase small subunit [Rhizobium sp. NLR17b]